MAEIDASELKGILADVGVQRSDAEIAQIIQSVDRDGSSALSFEELCDVFEAQRLRDVFHEMDADGSGYLTPDELRAALNELGYGLDEAQCANLTRTLDSNSDGRVDFGEFTEFFKAVPLANMKDIAEYLLGHAHIDVGTDMAPPLPSKQVSIAECLLVGGTAGVVSRTLTAPLERVKLQAQTVGVSSTYGELRRIVAAEGWASLWAGNLANCLRVFPFGGLVMVTYKEVLSVLPADDEFDSMEPVWRSVAGGIAGAVGTLATYPIDVIRAKLTVDGARYNHSILTCFRETVRTGGVSALYNGMLPSLYAVVPFLALQQSTHDVCKRLAMDAGFQPSVPLFLGCSMTAGAVAQTVVYPLDLVRRRLQVSLEAGAAGARVSGSAVAALSSVMRENGIQAAFSGIRPTYYKVIPAVMIAKTSADVIVGMMQAKKWKI